MKTKMTLADLQQNLMRRFATGVPNGWLLGWNERRLQSELATAVRPLKMQNCTSFDYAFCNHFDVSFDGDGEYYDYVLTIRISFVCDFYCLHWTRHKRSGNKEGRPVRTPETPDARVLERRVRELLAEHGFLEIPDEWMDEPAPEVKLELAGTRNVTISKCVFEDYEG